MAKFLLLFSACLVLFGSKFLILEVLEFAFRAEMQFKGAFHVVVTLIDIIVVIMVVEDLSAQITKALGLR
ncbi:hypothetical protein [Urechidicola sp. KH5]